MFDNIITPQFKQLFNESINTLLAPNSLAIPCKLYFDEDLNSSMLCNNCIFDPITQLSANIYNGSGPVVFSEGQTCPVCLGAGTVVSSSSEYDVDLAVIFDSKYWLNLSSKTVNVPDGMIQTLCSSSLLPKIRAAKKLLVDPNLSRYGEYFYERAGDPNPLGFGDTNYITTMWKRQ
jgi:hypothetical protein